MIDTSSVCVDSTLEFRMHPRDIARVRRMLEDIRSWADELDELLTRFEVSPSKGLELQPIGDGKVLLTVAEAAVRLNVSRTALYAMVFAAIYARSSSARAGGYRSLNSIASFDSSRNETFQGRLPVRAYRSTVFPWHSQGQRSPIASTQRHASQP